jgi:hypothetical protein
MDRYCREWVQNLHFGSLGRWEESLDRGIVDAAGNPLFQGCLRHFRDVIDAVVLEEARYCRVLLVPLRAGLKCRKGLNHGIYSIATIPMATLPFQAQSEFFQLPTRPPRSHFRQSLATVVWVNDYILGRNPQPTTWS